MKKKNDLGDRLYDIRVGHRLTQEKLAELLNISVKHYSEVERGVSGISNEKLKEFCNYFNVSFDYVVNGETKPQNEVPAEVVEIFTSGKYDVDLFMEYVSLFKKHSNML